LPAADTIPPAGTTAAARSGYSRPGGSGCESWARIAAALTVAALVTACAGTPRAPGASASAPSPPAFSLSGRLLVNDGTRRFSATLRWTQSANSRILLTTPMGQAVASIDVDAGGARLTAADGREFAAGSLSELARRGLGLTLPLERLPWWLNGRAAPDAPARVLEEGGFVQHGWTVRYGARDDTGRPLRLEAQCDAPCPDAEGSARPGGVAGAPSVRLIIDQWLDP
jgi:outer membrane lipoprotein LolB